LILSGSGGFVFPGTLCAFPMPVYTSAVITEGQPSQRIYALLRHMRWGWKGLRPFALLPAKGSSKQKAKSERR
jgi:hypothetical protein